MKLSTFQKAHAVIQPLVITVLILGVLVTAIYAIYTANRLYSPLGSFSTNSGLGSKENLRTRSPGLQTQSSENQSLTNDSSSQLQSGSAVEQGSSTSPQNAGTAKPYNNFQCDPNFTDCASPYRCDQRFMECPYLAD